MQHLDDGLLHELVDGEVPSEQLGPVQRHLADCASCRARLAAARDLASVTDALIEGLDTPAPQEHSETPVLALPVRHTTPRWSRTIGIAASLAVAAGLGYGARDLIPPPGEGAGATPRAARTAVLESPADAMVVSEPAAQEVPPVVKGTPPAAAVPPATATRNAPREALAMPPAGERARPEVSTDARDALSERQDIAQTPAREEARTEEAIAPRVAATAPKPTVGRARESSGVVTGVIGGTGPALSVSPRDQLLSAAKSLAAPRVVDLTEAMTRLGGTIRLVDGLVPLRLEAVGNEVQVIYAAGEGLVVLSQERIGSALRWRLTGPPGFPLDSLEVLRRRVER